MAISALLEKIMAKSAPLEDNMAISAPFEENMAIFKPFKDIILHITLEIHQIMSIPVWE